MSFKFPSYLQVVNMWFQMPLDQDSGDLVSSNMLDLYCVEEEV